MVQSRYDIVNRTCHHSACWGSSVQATTVKICSVKCDTGLLVEATATGAASWINLGVSRNREAFEVLG